MKRILIIMLASTLIACDSSRVYEDYNDFDEAFWHLDSLQQFTFSIKDTTRTYNLGATFRNASSYPFYNLYFQYTLVDSSGNQLIEQLKEVDLFDPKTGEPLGSGLGDLFDHSIVLEEGYQFKNSGDYTLSLQQFMRRDTLPFILSVGARVEFAEEN